MGRQLKKYGAAILKLESAVDSGKLDELKTKLNKFQLFSGAYRNDKVKRAKIVEAVEDGKADVVKTEYAKLVEFTDSKTRLKGAPVPKGARVVDLGSSGSGTAKFAVDALA